ncbi:MAG: hypothetical protein AAB801_02790 [Patescibacteria group bacterium]
MAKFRSRPNISTAKPEGFETKLISDPVSVEQMRIFASLVGDIVTANVLSVGYHRNGIVTEVSNLIRIEGESIRMELPFDDPDKDRNPNYIVKIGIVTNRTGDLLQGYYEIRRYSDFNQTYTTVTGEKMGIFLKTARKLARART